MSRPTVVPDESQYLMGPSPVSTFSSPRIVFFFCFFFVFRLQRDKPNGGNFGFLVSSRTLITCQANISCSVFTAKPLHISFTLRCRLGLVIIRGAWTLPPTPYPPPISHPPTPDTESLLLHNFSTQHFCLQVNTRRPPDLQLQQGAIVLPVKSLNTL